MSLIITKKDLEFVADLDNRIYLNKSLETAATLQEKERYNLVKKKLKDIAQHFHDKYNDYYGPFNIAISSGNQLNMQSKLRRPWSGIYKGNTNKQYAAQISFVINPKSSCLDVGFYFGRVSARDLPTELRSKYYNQLLNISNTLSSEISNDTQLGSIYNNLFDYGYKAFNNNSRLSPAQWLEKIKTNPENSEITYSIYPSADGLIELSVIDLFVSLIISLMNPIPLQEGDNHIQKKKPYKPLTPEQRAKQAERRTLIGTKGELHALEHEKNRLINNNITDRRYPEHVALKSMDYGYDILSCENIGNEIFIEVKTTTRLKNDPDSNKFFISVNEYEYYKNNKSKYKLYRVYDIEGSPDLEIVNMDFVEIKPNIYFATIK